MSLATPADHLGLYRSLGWRLVRAGRDKRPLGRWKAAQTTPMTDADWTAIRSHVEAGGEVGVVCGAISGGLAVVDLDTAEAQTALREALGPRWGTLPRASTPRGCHIYTVGEARTRGRSKSAGWDLRAEGGFAVLPLGRGERHWEVAPTGVGDLPAFASVAPHLPTAGEASPSPEAGLESASAGAGRSGGLKDLLAAPPQGDGSGRNDWLARVAGHYALRFPSFTDYEASVRCAAALLEPKLDEPEIAKLIPSIWSAEESKRERADAEREEKIRVEVERMEVRQEARHRLTAVEWEPPEVATDAAALLAQPLPEEQWAIEQLAGHGDNVLLAAQYKAGKTTLLLNLLRALADGEPFLGHLEAGAGVPVAWLNYELTDATAHRWLAEMGFQHLERVFVIGLRGHRNPLASRDGQAWLVEQLAERGVQFVAVDTFRAAYTGTDHNANAEVARFTALLDRVKQEANVPGLVLSHHFGRKAHEHGQEHGQGAVELDAWCDMRWLLTVEGGDRFLAANGRAEGIAESRLQYDPTVRRLWLPEGDVGVSRGTRAARDIVLLALRAEPGLNTRDLRRRCAEIGGADSVAINDAIRELCEEGRVVKRSGPNRSKPHYLAADDPERTDRLPFEPDDPPPPHFQEDPS